MRGAIEKAWGPKRRLLGRIASVILVAGLASLWLGSSSSPSEAAPCLAPPPVVRDVDVSGYYSDKNGSVVDKEKLARHDAVMRPMLEFLRQVVKDADRGTAGNAEAARCAARWLAAWAEGEAWLGELKSPQAEYWRKWDLAGYALAYIRVREHASPEQRQRIEAWLVRLADAARRFYDDPRRKRNNHWYWLGLALGGTAIATGSERHWEMARGIMKDAARDVAADGTLPHEMARGGRAIHYHAFSVMPIVMLAELAAAKGEDWYAFEKGAVHRLIDVTLKGLADPGHFARLAGVPQQGHIGGGSGWLHLYRLRFPDRLPATLPDTPRAHRWIGGDALLLKAALERAARRAQ